jgi:1-acyl-sn-glycerol-3-phosphate acyltransferase
LYLPGVTGARLLELGSNVPRSGGRVTRTVGSALLRILGWHIEGEIPNVAKAVIIVAPHTSNWDFPVGLAAKWALRLHANYLGKDSLFRFPFGYWFRAWGGLPVDRSRPNAVVSTIVAEFARRERMFLAIAPEGTRKPVERWRTGFYHIAHGARVPIVPVALNWEARAIQIGAPVSTTGDADRDVAELQASFAGIPGRTRS